MSIIWGQNTEPVVVEQMFQDKYVAQIQCVYFFPQANQRMSNSFVALASRHRLHWQGLVRVFGG